MQLINLAALSSDCVNQYGSEGIGTVQLEVLLCSHAVVAPAGLKFLLIVLITMLQEQSLWVRDSKVGPQPGR